VLSIKDNQAGSGHDDWIGPAPWIETALPGPCAESVIAKDRRFSSTTYTRDYPLVVKRAFGSVIEDVDGNRFLDFTAGIAVCATGHCHPKVVAAIQEQAARLIHICGCDFYYPVMAALLEKLSAIAPGVGDKSVFLTNSGTEAIEGAFKLARHHTGRKWAIAFHGGFHGRTMGALALTCSKPVQRGRFGPLVPMTAHVDYGNADAIESQLFRYKMQPDEVAAIFVEAIQGEGGYIIPPADFLPRLRALCDEHGILLVLDEIQSGMGRTGKWFACQHVNVVPDIVTVAKGIASGMPIGAIIARKEVATWGPGAHGSTFGGNPLSCAAALATIELIEKGLMENARKRGEQTRARLEEITEKRRCLTAVRGLGLMNAIDVVQRGKGDKKLRGRILEESFKRGLLLLGCGEHSIRFCPPLCMNEAQIDTGLSLFDEAVATVS
jgi:4-aminobutyrate aminotransferase